jgi:hypothetical protein
VSVVYPPSGTDLQVTMTGNGYALTPDAKTYGAVEVTVERRDAGIPGDLGWVPAGEPRVLAATLRPTGEMVWTGAVRLPAARGSEPMRLVVREFEAFGGAANARRLAYTDVLGVT